MGQTKNDLLGSIGVTNQEALVKFLQKPKTVQSVKKVIPGGKTLLSQVGKNNMMSAVYTWLRNCRSFTQVTISFAREPELYKLKREKVRDFDTSGPREIWETHPEGRKFLAREIAEIINQRKLVKLEATKEGIYIYIDLENKFSPWREVTAVEVEAAKSKIAKLKAKAEEENKSFQEPTLPEPGTKIPADDWEPYLEFVPKDRPEYGY